MESGLVTPIMLIDLSAAFDTVDHDIFLEVLHHKFGISDSALDWMDQYLRPCWFKVNINGTYSKETELQFSVPQGSCNGAFFFLMYAQSIEHIVPSYQKLSGFADDHSIQSSYNPSIPTMEAKAIADMEKSASDIKSWMDKMRLKMKGEKTEFIIIGGKQQLNKVTCQWHERNKVLWREPHQ